jgi:hypothetical protein
MHYIKMITPEHLDESLPWHYTIYPKGDARLNWMNYKTEADAERLEPEAQALVYATDTIRRVLWAVEYLEVIPPDKYWQTFLKPHGLSRNHFKDDLWKYFRPIRFLAQMDIRNTDYERIPTLAELGYPGGRVLPARGGQIPVAKKVWLEMFNKMPWEWKADGSVVTPKLPSYEMPPVPSPKDYIARIKQLPGLPERNAEDAVKEFFIHLGHNSTNIVFQQGRIDILVKGRNQSPKFVVEVKSSLAGKPEQEQARRQGFDYAGKVNAPIVVLSDGDRYIIYDKRKGSSYEEQLAGEFRLSRLSKEGTSLIALLRPD